MTAKMPQDPSKHSADELVRSLADKCMAQVIELFEADQDPTRLSDSVVQAYVQKARELAQQESRDAGLSAEDAARIIAEVSLRAVVGLAGPELERRSCFDQGVGQPEP